MAHLPDVLTLSEAWWYIEDMDKPLANLHNLIDSNNKQYPYRFCDMAESIMEQIQEILRRQGLESNTEFPEITDISDCVVDESTADYTGTKALRQFAKEKAVLLANHLKHPSCLTVTDTKLLISLLSAMFWLYRRHVKLKQLLEEAQKEADTMEASTETEEELNSSQQP